VVNGSATASCTFTAPTVWSTFGSCQDRDECANASLSKCTNHSLCVNSIGSFSCKCYVGYKSNTTTGKCDSKAWKCPTDGSICGYMNISIPFVPTGASSKWQQNFTNIVISNFSDGADPSQFVISYKPIASNGFTQVQIQISPYNTTANATTTNMTKIHDPDKTWMSIQSQAVKTSKNNSSPFYAYFSGLSAVEINPPPTIGYHDLALIGLPFLVIAGVLCAFFGRKRKDGLGNSSPNVTTLPKKPVELKGEETETETIRQKADV